ncbi:Adenylate cyclase [Burkholderia gladioli]|nr:Adenylate cyclase [Burkholderia gladioli]
MGRVHHHDGPESLIPGPSIRHARPAPSPERLAFAPQPHPWQPPYPISRIYAVMQSSTLLGILNQ